MNTLEVEAFFPIIIPFINARFICLVRMMKQLFIRVEFNNYHLEIKNHLEKCDKFKMSNEFKKFPNAVQNNTIQR